MLPLATVLLRMAGTLPAAMLLTATLGVNCAGAAEQNASPLHLKRHNLLVADLDRSLAIYRDILGFSVHAITESSADSYSYPVFRYGGQPQHRQVSCCSRSA